MSDTIEVVVDAEVATEDKLRNIRVINALSEARELQYTNQRITKLLKQHQRSSSKQKESLPLAGRNPNDPEVRLQKLITESQLLRKKGSLNNKDQNSIALTNTNARTENDSRDSTSNIFVLDGHEVSPEDYFYRKKLERHLRQAILISAALKDISTLRQLKIKGALRNKSNTTSWKQHYHHGSVEHNNRTNAKSKNLMLQHQSSTHSILNIDSTRKLKSSKSASSSNAIAMTANSSMALTSPDDSGGILRNITSVSDIQKFSGGIVSNILMNQHMDDDETRAIHGAFSLTGPHGVIQACIQSKLKEIEEDLKTNEVLLKSSSSLTNALHNNALKLVNQTLAGIIAQEVDNTAIDTDKSQTTSNNSNNNNSDVYLKELDQQLDDSFAKNADATINHLGSLLRSDSSHRDIIAHASKWANDQVMEGRIETKNLNLNNNNNNNNNFNHKEEEEDDDDDKMGLIVSLWRESVVLSAPLIADTTTVSDNSSYSPKLPPLDTFPKKQRKENSSKSKSGKNGAKLPRWKELWKDAVRRQDIRKDQLLQIEKEKMSVSVAEEVSELMRQGPSSSSPTKRDVVLHKTYQNTLKRLNRWKM